MKDLLTSLAAIIIFYGLFGLLIMLMQSWGVGS